jgi:glycosyltransferase involved in cell wall biosynthesis
MNNNPLISVLVPVFNRFIFIPRTLQSLKNQSYENIEVVVINDGGENAYQFVEELHDPRFKYVENPYNMGPAAARNTGLRNCMGEYISLLDSDDIYLQYALEFRIYMLQKLGVEIVYTRSLKNIMNHVRLSDGRKGYQIVHRELYWDQEFDRDRILTINVCPVCNPLFSRKAWEDSHYWFNEELTITEDQDFWIALSRNHDFHNLGLIDAECSYVQEQGAQMTGTRDFSQNLIKVFKRWRSTAININAVIEQQNSVLRSAGINPVDYGL